MKLIKTNLFLFCLFLLAATSLVYILRLGHKKAELTMFYNEVKNRVVSIREETLGFSSDTNSETVKGNSAINTSNKTISKTHLREPVTKDDSIISVDTHKANLYYAELETLGLSLVPEDMDRFRGIFVAFNKGECGTAKKQLKEQIQRDPYNPLWHLGIGICYSRAGLDIRSQRYLEKAMELVADHYDRSIENFVISWYKYYTACNKLQTQKTEEAEDIFKELVVNLKYDRHASHSAIEKLNELREERGLPPIN